MSRLINSKPSRLRNCLFGIALSMSPLIAQAEYLDLPPPGSDLVGRMKYVKARQSDTLIDVAHDFSMGQDEIVMANPAVSRWLPGEGTKVLIPDRFILPDAPRVGILVNIPEMRLYFFPPGEGKTPPTQVVTYPISIGRMDWKSPIGITKIVEKIKDPSWTPPESIKKEHALDGEILPDVVPPGPDNPLGRFAMRLGVKGSYLIHGTGQDKADGIGMMVTHGCMRMYPEDVEQLYPKVSVGTQVNLVNQPVKVGWQDNVLFIEVSQPLDEDHLTYDQLLKQATSLIQMKTQGRTDFVLNREALTAALQKPNGIPTAISSPAPGAVLTAQHERIPLVSRTAPDAGAATPSPTPSAPAAAVSNPVGVGAPSFGDRPQSTTPSQPYSRPLQTTPDATQGTPARVEPIPASVQPVQIHIPGAYSQSAQTPSAARRPVEAASSDVSRTPPSTPANSKPEQQLLPPIY